MDSSLQAERNLQTGNTTNLNAKILLKLEQRWTNVFERTPYASLYSAQDTASSACRGSRYRQSQLSAQRLRKMAERSAHLEIRNTGTLNFSRW